ncbi:MAG: lamin tail domain-containing protein [Candidatus Magasanikbacteria bacterium]
MKSNPFKKSWIWVVVLFVLFALLGFSAFQRAEKDRVGKGLSEKSEPINSTSTSEQDKKGTASIVEVKNRKDSQKTEKGNNLKTATVTYVIDGDTVKLDSGEKVRLLGINTPESGQPYFSEARDKMVELVEDKQVKLERDVTNRGRYGRLLRYIWVGDTLVNAKIARLGFAKSYSKPPDIKYQKKILEAVRYARENDLGLWNKPSDSEKNKKITILNFEPNAPGNDNKNKTREYFALKNEGTESINLDGWTARDEANKTFTFPDVVLEPNSKITVRSGCGESSTTTLYWCADEYAVWNNSGDTLFLRNPQGELVLEYSY